MEMGKFMFYVGVRALLLKFYTLPKEEEKAGH